MAELVKAWGQEYGSYEPDAEQVAASSAGFAVRARMRRAGLEPIDDIAIVETKTRKSGDVTYYTCQGAVRAVKR